MIRGSRACVCAVLLSVLAVGAWAEAKEGDPARPTLRLSLKRSVEIALSPEGNTYIQLAREFFFQARSRSSQARAALLPNLDGSAYRQSNTRNLDTLGLHIDVPPAFANLVRIPRLVGPFYLADARLSVFQSVFDISSIRRFQASRAMVRAASADRENTDEVVAARVAKSYVGALRTDAEVAAVTADLELAEAVVRSAENQRAIGTGTGIDVTRAKVEAANQHQRLLVAQNEQHRTHLSLLRAMGLGLDTEIELTDTLSYHPVDGKLVEEALSTALKSRPDLQAQAERESNARLAASASKLERLPTLTAYSDYGASGYGLDRALPTRTYGAAVHVPIFDGGRRDARRAETASQLRQEEIRSHDLRDQIEMEVRTAADSLRSAQEQLQVAEEGLRLAENELAQARRRYEAGMANGLEVTDAQTRLERARNNRIAALFNYNVARIDLGQATGSIRKWLD